MWKVFATARAIDSYGLGLPTYAKLRIWYSHNLNLFIFSCLPAGRSAADTLER